MAFLADSEHFEDRPNFQHETSGAVMYRSTKLSPELLPDEQVAIKSRDFQFWEFNSHTSTIYNRCRGRFGSYTARV